ncbi:MAG: Nif3-like dinuclear metal center hexameric protein [Bacteroidia bacterium]|nr:Nif3-like dinuclear metal center hexameric protein [Bacteroidia bacterium]
MKIRELIEFLEQIAPLSIQESYDNCGLLVGTADSEITRALITLDCTEKVVQEAIENGCNLIISHHPVIFAGLKKLNGENYVERTVILAIKNNIAIYAVHTNLDNLWNGVNHKIAEKLGLINCEILEPKKGVLLKLVTFVPIAHLANVKEELFLAGAGNIGNYSGCSFTVSGMGTYTGNMNTNPYAGSVLKPHTEEESRIEMVFPSWLKEKVLQSLIRSHPYEEVAYDLYELKNEYAQIGSGLIGYLPEKLNVDEFLALLKDRMQLQIIKYTKSSDAKINKVAICGGAGSFLLKKAMSAGAQAFVSSDFKYHEFFDAEERFMIADIGHFESEKFTKSLLSELILKKFPTFALLLSKSNTNPVNYYI